MLFGLLFGIFSVLGYIFANNHLQKKYYCELADSVKDWKLLPNKTLSLKDPLSWFPLNPYSNKERSKLQKTHYTISLLMLAIINTISVESYLNGYTTLHMDINYLYYLPFDIMILLTLNNGLFYYYHRLGHTKYMWKYIHKYHHFYKNPEPFDSLIAHPIDNIVANIFIILPIYFYNMHIITFIIYASIISDFGIRDHSGVEFKFLGYNSKNHYIHHNHPNKNFGTSCPFLIFDMIHGTYQSEL